MIRVMIVTDSSNQYKGFQITGHARYAESGFDIICSAVSALSLNAVNAIEKFTDDAFEAQQDDENGSLKFKFTDGCGRESRLLLDAMILGFENIQKAYGSQYINIRFKEV